VHVFGCLLVSARCGGPAQPHARAHVSVCLSVGQFPVWRPARVCVCVSVGQYRVWGPACVWRSFDEGNGTVHDWSVYWLETIMHEMLLQVGLSGCAPTRALALLHSWPRLGTLRDCRVRSEPDHHLPKPNPGSHENLDRPPSADPEPWKPREPRRT
jgi:hypothetical protein